MKLFITIFILTYTNLVFAKELNWENVKTPTSETPQIYGSYFNGCMDGGIKIPKENIGYYRAKNSYNRIYGQPTLINYIEKLGKKTYKELNRIIIIGDISSPRGGPAPINSSLHQSHQNGLDIDIWLRTATENDDPAKLKQRSMLKNKRSQVNEKYWNEDTIKLVKMAASFDEVDRIFIHSVLKKDLCNHFPKEQWMKKVRSWWGHHSHFHVRLKCPKGQKNCVTQKPVPDSYGCGEDLQWWFSNEATKTTTWKKRTYPKLPVECKKIFYQ